MENLGLFKISDGHKSLSLLIIFSEEISEQIYRQALYQLKQIKTKDLV